MLKKVHLKRARAVFIGVIVVDGHLEPGGEHRVT
jgi:hypothetical protein